MKRLFLTTSAAALMMGVVACSGADTHTQTAETDTTAMTETATYDGEFDTENDVYGDATTETNMVEADRDDYVLTSGEFLTSELIGEEVMDSNGEEVGEVEDVMLASGTMEPMLIIRDGFAGDLHAVSFEQASIWFDEEGEPAARMDLTEEMLDDLQEFEQNGMNDYRLASELTGTNINLAFNDKDVRVTDLIMKTDGQAKYAVVSDGIVEAVTDKRFLIDPSKIMVAQGDSDGEIVIDLSEQEFNSALGFTADID
ncbi:PRC-barrel domain-containing protein [Hyphomonas sp.]|uniref:PRC-barrel domain-containing protein n=1 Tax=Hyphomonas sp. TaxID=87 RepID=UPI00260E8122|nr:PRC-barrel domain-containing protein [Hyphomonas sp.]MDF1806638.1 PRC-barrel domain-containing protein [Hyphomonas sp.]